MPLLCKVGWIKTMVESSSVEEEDREFECKKANEVIIICLRDSSLYPLSRRLGKHHARCLVPSPPEQPAPLMTRGAQVHLSNDTGQTMGNSRE
jgi:hypothetical protein